MLIGKLTESEFSFVMRPNAELEKMIRDDSLMISELEATICTWHRFKRLLGHRRPVDSRHYERQQGGLSYLICAGAPLRLPPGHSYYVKCHIIGLIRRHLATRWRTASQGTHIELHVGVRKFYDCDAEELQRRGTAAVRLSLLADGVETDLFKEGWMDLTWNEVIVCLIGCMEDNGGEYGLGDIATWLSLLICV
ncbi:hypothetical protein Tco_1418692 [Tanacetum coccineum]